MGIEKPLPPFWPRYAVVAVLQQASQDSGATFPKHPDLLQHRTPQIRTSSCRRGRRLKNSGHPRLPLVLSRRLRHWRRILISWGSPTGLTGRNAGMLGHDKLVVSAAAADGPPTQRDWVNKIGGTCALFELDLTLVVNSRSPAHPKPDTELFPASHARC